VSLDPLPCPFCAGTSYSVGEGSTFRWWRVSCDECGTEGPEIRRQTLGEGSLEQWDAQAYADAIAAWNKRVKL
jgi:Lar family restriction alleviation protein